LYNRSVRIALVLAAVLSLAACNRSERNKEALRQGVLDHLASSALGLNMAGMDVALTEVHLSGSQADVTASITPKGASAANGMAIQYHLEERNSKWVVTGRQDSGGSPHGGMSGGAGAGTAANPHGGAMPDAGAGKMPSPEDLPPTGKKK
jgi:hypothetical protein